MGKYFAQQDFNGIPVKGLVPETNSTAPPTPKDGQLWTDSSVVPKVVRYWNGSAWIRMNGSDIPDGTINNAKIAAGAGILISKLEVDPRARATHTGTQTASTISDFDAQVRTSRIDQMGLPTTAFDLNGQRAINAAQPVNPSDLATKKYVDDARAGLAVKDPVRVVAASNVTLTAPGATIDGVALSVDDRFLATAQTNSTQNGIYLYKGSATAAVRAADADGVGEVVDGTLVAVAEGTYQGSQWIQTASASGSPGTWTQTWVQYSAGGQTYTAGNGLSLAANEFSVKAADATITVGTGGISVGTVPINKGGTGATTATAARTALGAPGTYVSLLPSLTAGAWTAVTHNLNTLYPLEPSFEEVSTKEYVRLASRRTADPNVIEVRSDVALASGTIRVTVIG